MSSFGRKMERKKIMSLELFERKFPLADSKRITSEISFPLSWVQGRIQNYFSILKTFSFIYKAKFLNPFYYIVPTKTMKKITSDCGYVILSTKLVSKPYDKLIYSKECNFCESCVSKAIIMKFLRIFFANSKKLKGTPWWSSRDEGVRARQLIMRVIATLLQNGYRLAFKLN